MLTTARCVPRTDSPQRIGLNPPTPPRAKRGGIGQTALLVGRTRHIPPPYFSERRRSTRRNKSLGRVAV